METSKQLALTPSPPAPKVIKVNNFRKKFRHNKIGPFNFNVTKGKMHAILGASGSGKTVVIKSLVGGFKHYKGEILIMEKKAGSVLAKKQIGYVPEFVTFPESISAYNFLKNLGKTNGLRGKYLKYRIEYLMKSLGIWEHRDKNVNSFSSGMKKRIMIVQGILHDPDILILDEPEAGLDIDNRNKIINYLKNLTLRGKTVFFSSHLLNEIKEYIDEFTMVMDGQQYYTGSIAGFNVKNTYFLITNSPTLITQFLNYRQILNWYEKKTNKVYFVIKTPLMLANIMNYAVKNMININKIGKAEFSFNFLNQKLAMQNQLPKRTSVKRKK